MKKVALTLIAGSLVLALGCGQPSTEFARDQATAANVAAGDLVFNVEGLT